MSWMGKLVETYENCVGREPEGFERLAPIAHTTQQAQIEIVIDGTGAFRRAAILLEKDESTTLIPCTEESGGRSGSKPVSHPLCDKLQYIARDYLDYGGTVTSGFGAEPGEPHRGYLECLRGWVTSGPRHPKLDAILRYVERGHVIADLVRERVLPLAEDGTLLKSWTGDKGSAPLIFRTIQKTQSPEDAFVRWRVEEPGQLISATWEDPDLTASWISYYQGRQRKRGYCMVTGRETALSVQHPAKLRHAGDKAKLISANDTSGYTFRGRFLEPEEAATVGFEVTQKAHIALRWLIQHQAFRGGDPVIVSWAPSGKPLPSLLDNTLALIGLEPAEAMNDTREDTAQAYALRLARAIAGYRAKLDACDDIVVMGLDSATPGRMAITLYRELKGSEFLERVERWHNIHAWPQNFGRELKFTGAPAPRDIAEAVYGRRLDERLRKATVERLLPCIIDGVPIPRDLVMSTSRRAANRMGMEIWEWEKCLGIACALFRGHHIAEGYEMGLEEKRTSRDYLYGRLLAIADNIEGYALSLAGENRDTTAARLMQRFADHPASTWRTIELSLRPYMARLRSGERSTGFLVKRARLLDEVMASFRDCDFTNDVKLSGEFLLGYHCQRQHWRVASKDNVAEDGPQAREEN